MYFVPKHSAFSVKKMHRKRGQNAVQGHWASLWSVILAAAESTYDLLLATSAVLSYYLSPFRRYYGLFCLFSEKGPRAKSAILKKPLKGRLRTSAARNYSLCSTFNRRHFGCIFSRFRVIGFRIGHFPFSHNLGPKPRRISNGETNLYQISGHDSPLIGTEEVYFQVLTNCTVLKRWPSNLVWVKKRLKSLRLLTPCEI